MTGQVSTRDPQSLRARTISVCTHECMSCISTIGDSLDASLREFREYNKEQLLIFVCGQRSSSCADIHNETVQKQPHKNITSKIQSQTSDFKEGDINLR